MHCVLFAKDPDNICDKTVLDPAFLERSPSRIDKDPDRCLPFHVWLRILPVTVAKTFATSEVKMLLSDECGISILGSCRGVRSLIIKTLRQLRYVDIDGTQEFLVCLSDQLMVHFKNLFSVNVNDSVLQ